VKAGKVKGLDPASPLRSNAQLIISTRLGELLSFGDAAVEPRASKVQHDMRIAAKRLRYVLEITEGCFGREAKAARAAAKELQSVLGDIHDCDVMSPRVQAQVEELRCADVRAILLRVDSRPELDPTLVGTAPNRAAYQDLALLAVHIEARRALLHKRFAKLWRDQHATGIWSALERAVRR
jgi:CHAD domain